MNLSNSLWYNADLLWFSPEMIGLFNKWRRYNFSSITGLPRIEFSTCLSSGSQSGMRISAQYNIPLLTRLSSVKNIVSLKFQSRCIVIKQVPQKGHTEAA